MNPRRNDAAAPPPAIEFIARGVLMSPATEGASGRGHVLVCRNLKHGYCYLPGGHVEFDESPADACAREFMEETGLPVRVRRGREGGGEERADRGGGECLLVCEARFDQRAKRRHEVSVVFLVEHAGLGDPPAASDPVASLEPGIAFEWLSLDALRSADLRPRAMRDWLIGRWDASSAGGWGDTTRPDWISVSV